jgi:ubiquinone/menaquinone biosynthesis C-methylase UbiE
MDRPQRTPPVGDDLDGRALCHNPWAAAPSVAADYEEHLVPILFDTWAHTLVRIANPRTDERVLDIACGTGIVARTVAARRASQANITGIDINPDMLAVARRAAPGIGWTLADATATGLPDASFDVALCQQGLQFLTDPLAALRDWRRVLVPGGRLVVSTWHDPDNLGYAPIRAALERHLPDHTEAIGFLQAIFALSDPTEVHGLLVAAGFHDVNVDVHSGVVDCPTPRAWIEAFLSAAPVQAVATADDKARGAIIAEVTRELRSRVTGDSRLTFPIQTNIATATA